MNSLDLSGAIKAVRALEKNVDYCDAIQIYTKSISCAYRFLSQEISTYSDSTVYLRTWSNGVWSILSSNVSNFTELLKKKSTMRRYATGHSGEMYKVHPVKGTFSLGDNESMTEDEVLDILKTCINTIESKSRTRKASSEVSFTHTISRKLVINSDGSQYIESRGLAEIAIYLISGEHVAGEYSAFLSIDHLKDTIEDMVEGALERLRAMATARPLNPLLYNTKQSVILDYMNSGALFHEIVHMLEADRIILFKRYIRRTQVLSDELTIIDDPTITWAVGSMKVDDEGVLCRPKHLIENGRIVNLLHTRWTASVLNSEPMGNARGISVMPRPMQTNLVIRPGDWRLEEMIEETRRGFILEGLVKAELHPDGVIVLEPEIARVVEKGEIKNSVKIRRVLIPLKALLDIDAVGKRLYYRASIEKTFTISELTPYIRLSYAYIT